ncbi:MAG: glycerate kinase type-2 family protein [Ignavibacteria bacterium]
MDVLLIDFEQIITHTLKAISPSHIFQEKILIDNNQINYSGNSFELDRFEKIFVIGFGKASSAMATEIEKYLLNKITGGLVITKYGFKTPTKKIKVFEAGHPLPDKNTLKYSKGILDLLSKTTENDLVICLISGGGSSLFEVPIEGIDLETLQSLNGFLIKQKIPINKINYFRKAFSKIKGGKLLNYIFPSTCISFIISDVVENDISVIASGPTHLDANELFINENEIPKIKNYLNSDNALTKLESLVITKSFPEELIQYNNSRVFNYIVASNKTALDASVEIAKKLGYEIHSLKYELSKSVDEISIIFIDDFLQLTKKEKKSKQAIIYGSETYLEVKGNGKGGRNQHLVLTIMNELIKKKIEIDFKFLISSFATDGNDGNTDAAGAFFNNEIINKIIKSNYPTEIFLQNFDSYNFFNQFDCLIKTGPTFTNVADLFICLTF